MKTFKFQFAREVHFDIVHNFCMYMCKLCEKGEDPEQKGIKYSYFELLDHSYSFLHHIKVFKYFLKNGEQFFAVSKTI